MNRSYNNTNHHISGYGNTSTHRSANTQPVAMRGADPSPQYGTAVPLSFEPKSSAGHLASFCVHCHQRIECHGSYWVINHGTLRVCDPKQVDRANEAKRNDENFRETLRQQEADNCRPTRTAANMPRYDAPYAQSDEARYAASNNNSTARIHVTKVLQPIMTPYGTVDNNADRDQTEARRGRRAVDSNQNCMANNFYGAGAVNTNMTPQQQSSNRSRYY